MALCYKLLMAYVWSWTGPFRTINSRVLCCFCHVFVWVLFRPEDCMMNRVTRFICDLGKHLVIFMAHLAKCRGKIENWKAQRKLPPFFALLLLFFFHPGPVVRIERSLWQGVAVRLAPLNDCHLIIGRMCRRWEQRGQIHQRRAVSARTMSMWGREQAGGGSKEQEEEETNPTEGLIKLCCVVLGDQTSK